MLKNQIEKIIVKAAEDIGYTIYDFSIYLKGENSKISVKLDSINGISHEDCEEYSKLLDNLLEDDEILPNYSLEVSSPGLKRKLRSIDEFIRFKGSPVKIICDIDKNREVIKGKIEKIINNCIEIKSDNRLYKILYDDIKDANLDY